MTPDATTSPPAAYPQWQLASPPNRNPVSDGLLLAGGIVGIVLSALALLFLPMHYLMMQQIMGAAPWSGFDFGATITMMYVVMALLAVVCVVGGICCLAARSRLRRSAGHDGKGLAITGAVLMLASLNWIAGTLGLIGAILAEPQPPRP